MNIPDPHADLDILAMFEGLQSRFGRAEALVSFQSDGSPSLTLTYDELFKAISTTAERLIELGLKRDERIVLFGESGPEWCIVCLAIMACRGVVVAIDPEATGDEVTAICSDCAAHVAVVSPSCEPRWASMPASKTCRAMSLSELTKRPWSSDPGQALDLRERRLRRASDVALVAYTSGSTGVPKGAMIAARSLLFQVDTLKVLFGLGRGDRVLSMLPLHHMFGLTCGALCAQYSGASVAFASTRLPLDVCELSRSHSLTHVVTVPAFLRLLRLTLRRPEEVVNALGKQFRCFISGGAPLDVDDEDFFRAGHAPVMQGYGMTETSPVISSNGLNHHRRGSVGKPLPAIEVRISPDGEILTRGPHVMLGYSNQPALSRSVLDPDAWLRTGDLGYVDEDGFLFVRGRLKTMIVLGSGKKVEPLVVEQAVAMSRDIAECCAIGLPRREGALAGTEELCIVVRPASRDAARAPKTWEDVILEATKDLAKPYQPSRIVVVDQPFPRTNLGKIRRASLIELVRQSERSA